MDKEIIIESMSLSGPTLEKTLSEQLFPGTSFELRKDTRRGIPHDVLVAVITASGSILGVIIAQIFTVFSSKKGEKIIIELKNGRIEAPSSISKDELDALVKAIDSDDKPKIILP